MKKIIALVLCLMLSIGIVSPALAINEDVTYSATASKANFLTDTQDQTFTVEVAPSRAVTTGSVTYKIGYDPALELTGIACEQLGFTGAAYNVSAGTVNWFAADDDLTGITSIGTLTFKIPANTPAGTYTINITEIEQTEKYIPFSSGSSASCTITVAEQDPDTAGLQLYYEISGGVDTDGDTIKEFDPNATFTADVYAKTENGTVKLQAYDVYFDLGANLEVAGITPVQGVAAADKSYFCVAFDKDHPLNLSVGTTGVKLATVTFKVKDSIVFDPADNSKAEKLNFKSDKTTLSLDGTTKSFHTGVDNLKLVESKIETLKQITVQFDGNKPADADAVLSGSTADQTVGYNVPTALTANGFAVTGYKFTGWNTAANGSGTAYADKASYDFKADMKLYAQWEPDFADYTVKHMQQNVNDDGYTEVAADRETISDKKTGETTAATAKTYTGFTAQEITQQTVKADGSTVVEIKYDRNKHDVTYSYTGTVPAGAPAVPAAQTEIKYGAEYTVADAPTMVGYTFSGWSKTGTQTMGDEDVTITGSWTAKPVTVTLDPNHDGLATSTITVTFADKYTGLTDPAARTGYTFAGWFTEAEGGTQVTVDTDVTNENAHTLYAHWTANTYTVKFDKNASDATGTMTDQSFTYDVEQALTDNAFTRTGYRFTGWNTAADGSGDAYSNKQSVKNLTAENGSNVTLYAQWELNITMKVEKYQYVNMGYGLLLVAPDGTLPSGQTYFYNYDGESVALYSTTNADYQKLISDTYSGTVYFTLVKTNAAEDDLAPGATVTLASGTAEALDTRDGDVNGDNRVDITDANLVFQMIMDRDHYALNAISVKGRLIADMDTAAATMHASILDVKAIVDLIHGA